MRIFKVGIIALAGLLAFSFQVSAEQSNRIIHSGDYDSYRVGPRQGWGACERSCNSDPRCNAWTFIRNSRQCRLKFVVGESVRNNCCVSGVKRQAASRPGGSLQRFCSDYAKQATDAQNANLAGRCSYKGNRWHTNFTPHYQYCLRVSRAETDGETEIRKNMIDRCRSHAGGSKQKRCDHYARISVEQASTNREAGCGFSGPGWNGRLRRYMKRCQQQRRAVSLDATLRRERQLRACLSIR